MSNKKCKPLASFFRILFWNLSVGVFGISIITFFLFKNPLINLFDRICVQPILATIESNLLTALTIGIFSALVIGYFIYNIVKNREQHSHVNFLIFFIGFIYFYYRFFEPDTWILYPINYSLAYADLIVLIVICASIHALWTVGASVYSQCKSLKNPPKNSSFFSYDKWEIGDEDLANRNTSAERLADEIKKLYSDTSFAIGINGDWGSGKTAFIKMLRDQLEKEENILVIPFNPWRSTTPQSIIGDFFDTLRKYLRRYSFAISSNLHKYAKKLAAIDSKGILGLYETITSPDDNLEDLFNRANKIIKRFNKKLVIIIDDLDRLDPEEVIEVIRLVRNTANFHNTIFVVAYDKAYVNSAIHEKLNKHNSAYFLEKIFQVEITLPKLNHDLLKTMLADKLIEKFPLSKADIESELRPSGPNRSLDPVLFDRVDEYNLNFLPFYLKTFRDLHRFMNLFTYNYGQVEGEVVFRDYFLLEWLRIKFHYVHTNLENILTSEVITINEIKQTLLVLDENKLNELAKNDSHTSQNITTIKNTLVAIFGKRLKDTRSMSVPSSFPIYLSNQLFESVSIVQFTKFRREGFKELKTYIDEQVSLKREKEIVQLIDEISHPFDSKKDFETISESQTYVYSQSLYNWLKFLKKLSMPLLKPVVDSLYDGKTNEVKGIIQDLLGKYSPNMNISGLLGELIREYLYERGNDYIINLDDAKKLAVSFFKKHIGASTRITAETFEFYRTCVDIIDEKKFIHFIDEANKLFRDFIEKHPYDYLGLIIYDYGIPNVEDLYVLEPCIDQVFSSYSNFEEFLNKQDPKIEEVNRVKVFYDQYKANGYKPIKWPKELPKRSK